MGSSSSSRDQVVDSIARFMRRTEMVLGGERVLVAVSGGVDSVALLDIVNAVAPVLRLSIDVAHFDHRLRDESEEDLKFVKRLASTCKAGFYSSSADIQKLADKEGGSIEEVARSERYAFLERIARRHRHDVVMTGHTADDNAETLIMNLLRGSGVTGLAAIPPTRRLAGPTLIARPLLETMKSDIVQYAEDRGLKWREDVSNLEQRFTRNRVRREVMPLLKTFNPNIVETLNGTADLMREFDRYLSSAVDASIDTVVNQDKDGERISLHVTQMRHLEPVIRGEVIQRLVTTRFGTTPLTQHAVRRALELLWKESGARASLGNRIEALRDRDTIVLLKTMPVLVDVDKEFDPGADVTAGDTTIKSKLISDRKPKFIDSNLIEFVDADSVNGRLTLRSWRDGDRFHPLGMKGQKKVSDFLTDRKVPLDQKRRVLVLTDEKKIVWVCGMRIDNRCRVTPKSKRYLRLELKEA